MVPCDDFFFKVREVSQKLGSQSEFLVTGDLKKKSSHGTIYPRVFFAGKDVPPQSLHNPPSYVQNSHYPPSYSTFTPEYPHTSHTHTPINVPFPQSTFRNFARKRSRRSTPFQYSKVQPPPISQLAHRFPIGYQPVCVVGTTLSPSAVCAVTGIHVSVSVHCLLYSGSSEHRGGHAPDTVASDTGVGRGSCGWRYGILLSSPFLLVLILVPVYFPLFNVFGGLHRLFNKLGAPTYHWTLPLPPRGSILT